MDKRKLLLQLIMEVKPDLLKGKDAEKLTLEDLTKMVAGEEFAAIRQAFGELAGVAKPAAPAASNATAPAAQELEVAALVNESVKRAMFPQRVEAAIREAGLEKQTEAAALVRDLAAKSPGDEAHLAASVKRAQKLLESAGWTDPKLTSVTAGDEPRDRYVRAIEGAMCGRPQKGVPPFRSLQHMAQVMCGVPDVPANAVLPIANACLSAVVAKYTDWRDGAGTKGPLMESLRRKLHESARANLGPRLRMGIKETINLAQMPDIFGDEITRQIIADYELPALNDWRAIASKIGFVPDSRVQRRERLGYYPDLATVAEGGAYTAITALSDQEVTLTVEKHGNFEQITEESILRNDLGWFAKVPRRLAMTAMQDVRKTVWDLLLANSALTFDDDVTALFTAGHANQDASALSVAAVSTGRQRMRKQKTFGSTFHELGSGNIPKFLIVPPELENTANQITTSQFEPTSNLFQVANLNKGYGVIVLDHTTDANDWFMVADPANVPTLEVDFVGNSDAPELWTQDNPTQGEPFDSDKIKVKVRQWFGTAIIDFRSLYRGNPA